MGFFLAAIVRVPRQPVDSGTCPQRSNHITVPFDFQKTMILELVYDFGRSLGITTQTLGKPTLRYLNRVGPRRFPVVKVELDNGGLGVCRQVAVRCASNSALRDPGKQSVDMPRSRHSNLARADLGGVLEGARFRPRYQIMLGVNHAAPKAPKCRPGSFDTPTFQ
jgi:hypothetical protein